MAETVSGVELRDIASGKLARVVATGATYDILRRGVVSSGDFDLPENAASRRPCRAIVAPGGGEVQILGLDGELVTLPDTGGAWQWNVQAIEIVTSDNGVVVLY